MSTANRRQGNRRRHQPNKQNNTVNDLAHWRRNEVDSETEKKLAQERHRPRHDEPEDPGLHVCVVCANPIEIAALSPCNHIVCHLCAFRQRALYDKQKCLICRSDCDRLIFTDDPPESHRYSDVDPASIVASDDTYGVDFTSEYARRRVLGLLQYRCPVEGCDDKDFGSFKRLNQHVRDVHNKVYCPLCGKFKKAFVSELTLYTTRQLQIHESKGLKEEVGFAGHPMCKFCHGKRFYSEDELFIHMREKHERCQVCDQIDASHPQYFRDYNQLFEHFRKDHYICNVQSCLDKKFIVFRDPMDLQAHMIKEHGEIYGGGNVVSMGSSGFGTNLTTMRNVSNDSLNINQKKKKSRPARGEPLAVRKLRLEERARHYLQYSQAAFKQFQDANRQFDDGKIKAADLYAQYKRIFGSKKDQEDPVDYAMLIYDLSGLYPSNSPKRKDLDSINAEEMRRRKINEQFPELPGSMKSRVVVSGGWKSRGISSSGARHNELFPALPTSNRPIFRSQRMGRSESAPSWAPPLNASSVPGYLPRRTKASRRKPAAQTTTTTTTSMSSILSTPPDVRPSVHIGTSRTFKLRRPQKKSKPVDTSLFPELPTTKKRGSRAKAAQTGLGQWGRQDESEANVFETTSLRQALGGGKKTTRKKKKNVVLHIGIGH